MIKNKLIATKTYQYEATTSTREVNVKWSIENWKGPEIYTPEINEDTGLLTTKNCSGQFDIVATADTKQSKKTVTVSYPWEGSDKIWTYADLYSTNSEGWYQCEVDNLCSTDPTNLQVTFKDVNGNTKTPITYGSGALNSLNWYIGGKNEKISDNFLRGFTDYNGNITFDGGIKFIGNNFMYGCETFSNAITIPSSLISIGNYFMGNCKGVNGAIVTFETNSICTLIGNGFLFGCKGISDVIIPKFVQYIGTDFCTNCDALMSVKLCCNLSAFDTSTDFTLATTTKISAATLTGITVLNSSNINIGEQMAAIFPQRPITSDQWGYYRVYSLK